jgi:NTP pyrophosphatase (non-canonical NTP hydrolase)
MTDDSTARLQERLRDFAARRDWEQFHTPKNLAMALAAEIGELLEHFQWLTPEQSVATRDDPDTLQSISDEIADVLIYLVQLADALGIDPLRSANAKMDRNEHRFPPLSQHGSPNVTGRDDGKS